MELRAHPLRQRLNDEVHTRPPIPLEAPALISFMAFTRAEHTLEAERAHIGRLYERLGLPVAPSEEAAHLIIDCGEFRLKWELHGEFSTYTFFAAPRRPARSGETALDIVPQQWVKEIPGQIISASHIELLAKGSYNPTEIL